MSKSYSWLMKFSLLSISLVLISSSSVSGAIPLIAAQFPEIPLTIIELISTIPSLACMITVLISVPVSEKIGIRTCTVLGLCIALLGGVLPSYTNSFLLILCSRLALGIGFGLFNSSAISMIQMFFHGREATRMIGIRSAFEGLGGALMTLMAGWFLTMGWHQAFWIYYAIVPITILFILFVPRVPKVESEGKKERVFNRRIIPYMVVIFLIMIFYNCLNIKLPSLLVSRGLGDGSTSSLIFSISQLVFVVFGFLFGPIYRVTKKWLLPGAILLMAGGYFLIALTESVALYCLGSFLTGTSFALISPYLFNMSAHIGDPASIPLSNSLLIVAVQLGAFVSPFVLAALELLPGMANEFAQCFLSCAVGCILFAAGAFFFQLKSREE